MSDLLLEQIIGSLGSIFLRGLYHTWQWCGFEGGEYLQSSQGASFVFAFWHGEQLGMPALYHRARECFGFSGEVRTLISEHRDGRIIARATQLLGLRSVAGSSTNGARRALRQMARFLGQGDHVAITPDGPRGPARVAKPGVIAAARLSGAPVLPLGFAARSFVTFKSWDKMMLPAPFTNVAGVVGAPISVPRELSPSQEAQMLKVVGDAITAASLRAIDLVEGK